MEWKVSVRIQAIVIVHLYDVDLQDFRIQIFGWD